MDEKKPMIIFTKYSPYYAVDVPDLSDLRGQNYPLSPVTALCRCGASKHKPYCDGSHSLARFIGEKDPDRRSNRIKEYVGAQISVVDNRGVCDHNGTCINLLPSVFRMSTRPWINPDGESPEKIIEIIKQCPSGALSYQMDGVRYQAFERPPAMKIVPGAGIRVEGGIKLKDDLGNQPECAEHYSLCRCSHSLNKPFCDGSHFFVDFDEVPAEDKGDPEENSAPYE